MIKMEFMHCGPCQLFVTDGELQLTLPIAQFSSVESVRQLRYVVLEAF